MSESWGEFRPILAEQINVAAIAQARHEDDELVSMLWETAIHADRYDPLFHALVRSSVIAVDRAQHMALSPVGLLDERDRALIARGAMAALVLKDKTAP